MIKTLDRHFAQVALLAAIGLASCSAPDSARLPTSPTESSRAAGGPTKPIDFPTAIAPPSPVITNATTGAALPTALPTASALNQSAKPRATDIPVTAITAPTATAAAVSTKRRPSGAPDNSATSYDPSTGQWSRTGGPAVNRSNPAIAPLPGGKALVVGGQADGCLDGVLSAEVYDPATGEWTPTGSAAANHTYVDAIPLRDGRVLLAGGEAGASAVGSAEVYDPNTGAWMPTGSMHTPRTAYGWVRLPDGRVLIVGSTGSVHSAELYDPATGIWSPTSDMNAARIHPPAAVLADGRVLVVSGGAYDRVDPVSTSDTPSPEAITADGVLLSSEIYNPATDTWTPTGNAPFAPLGNIMVLPDGKVLAVGNVHHEEPIEVELYDPATGAWTRTGHISRLIAGGPMALLPNGSVLVLDGYRGPTLGADRIPGAELYDPATGIWTPIDPADARLASFVATTLSDGRLLFLDGQIGALPYEGPVVGAWKHGADGAMRFDHTATLLADGQVLVAGGNADTFHPARSVNHYSYAGGAVYDPRRDAWKPTGSMITPRFQHTATLLMNGKVLIAGGWNEGSVLNTIELYDPASNTWARGSPMGTGHVYHTATLLRDGRVLVLGGSSSYYLSIESAELYDPKTNTWAPASNLHTARMFHTATLLQDGRVLVAGGAYRDTTASSESLLVSAELYDPKTNTWTQTSSMHTPREYHTATLLEDGRVLVVGGNMGCQPGGAEVYNPKTGTWADASEPNLARYAHTATLLQNGTVLIVGDDIQRGEAQIYNPGTGGWVSAGRLLAGRSNSTASLLQDGRVLIIGGTGGTGTIPTSAGEGPNFALSSVEMYRP